MGTIGPYNIVHSCQTYSSPHKLCETPQTLLISAGNFKSLLKFEREAGEWGNWMKEVKRYKLTVIRQVSHRDIMYSIVITVNDTELCI